MWGSDYPHTDGIWPESTKYIEQQFQGLSARGHPQDHLRERREVLQSDELTSIEPLPLRAGEVERAAPRVRAIGSARSFLRALKLRGGTRHPHPARAPTSPAEGGRGFVLVSRRRREALCRPLRFGHAWPYRRAMSDAPCSPFAALGLRPQRR